MRSEGPLLFLHSVHWPRFGLYALGSELAAPRVACVASIGCSCRGPQARCTVWLWLHSAAAFVRQRTAFCTSATVVGCQVAVCVRKAGSVLSLLCCWLNAGNGHAELAAKRDATRGRTPARPPPAIVPGPAATDPADGSPAPAAPLSAVVSNAVRRWFIDAHKEAIRGDVVRASLRFGNLPCLTQSAARLYGVRGRSTVLAAAAAIGTAKQEHNCKVFTRLCSPKMGGRALCEATRPHLLAWHALRRMAKQPALLVSALPGP